MLNNEASIERKDYKVHFRSYSDKLYGYRIILNNEPHFIINDTLMGDKAIETLYRLIDLASEYHEYGFVMLQEGNRVFVDYDYQFNKIAGKYIRNDGSKIVDINQYKYTLQHGIEKFKNRWDL